MAKLIGHITWSCLLRRPALSLINAGYRFARTFGPRIGRVWPAVGQELRSIASLLPLLTCNLASPWSPWVYATDASGGARGGYGVTRRKGDPETVAAAGSCAGRWRFSAEEFICAWRSVLIENERKASPLLGASRRVFSQCLVIALSSKKCSIHHSTAHVSLLRAVWRCLEEVFGDNTGRG